MEVILVIGPKSLPKCRSDFKTFVRSYSMLQEKTEQALSDKHAPTETSSLSSNYTNLKGFLKITSHVNMMTVTRSFT